ncbi:Nuclear factor interleukin-3-regulated protein [Dissostichus eleginoides]|uniref:Nuclear factor interleukin-3-regulated protein n=1 Tax=Dissostichus eleginoides TaxID=100907 RepID=A0AAD9B545_DISEL|nr:Nuclear factor interleukin-3-regulated protein [Dissostichus eleginoides]
MENLTRESISHGSQRKSKNNMNCRRKREFISDEKKDACYWEKRRKNNEAASAPGRSDASMIWSGEPCPCTE